MGATFYFEWEVQLIEWIQSHIGSFGQKLAEIFTFFGEEAILVAIIGFVYWCYNKDFGRFVGVSILTGLTVNPMIKNIALRRRPYFDHKTIKCLKQVSTKGDMYDISVQGFSFPSAHSMNSTIVYESLAVYTRKKILVVIAIVLPFIIGISRFALGVHYPTDVMVGWAVGTIVVFGISYLQKKIKRIEILYAGIFLVSAVGLFYCRTEDYFTGFGIMIGFFAGDIFERKYVNFKNTRNPLECVIRILGGFIIYSGLAAGTKLPFSKEFLERDSFGPFFVRVVRYAIIGFVAFGLYPMLFEKIGRLVNRNESREG